MSTTEAKRVTLKALRCMAVNGSIVQPGALFQVDDIEGDHLVAAQSAALATEQEVRVGEVVIAPAARFARAPGW